MPYEQQGQKLEDFPQSQALVRSAIEARPAVMRAYQGRRPYRRRDATVDDEAKKVLFGQTAAVLRR